MSVEWSLLYKVDNYMMCKKKRDYLVKAQNLIKVSKHTPKSVPFCSFRSQLALTNHDQFLVNVSD